MLMTMTDPRYGRTIFLVIHVYVLCLYSFCLAFLALLRRFTLPAKVNG
jgi:hypothetical protein